MKIAAIVSARNEEANIGKVLKVLLKSKELDEVIVSDGNSSDRTREISKSMGAKVLVSSGKGKGEAMRKGIKSTKAGIIAFFDADLIGLRREHISSLIEPVLKKEAMMSVGLRGRLAGLPKIIAKIDPLLAIGGERAMRRSVFENLPPKFIKGFAVETTLNYYCLRKKLPVRYVELKGLDVIVKEKKWGLVKGFLNRLKMMWQMLKIRFLLLAHRKEF